MVLSAKSWAAVLGHHSARQLNYADEFRQLKPNILNFARNAFIHTGTLSYSNKRAQPELTALARVLLSHLPNHGPFMRVVLSSNLTPIKKRHKNNHTVAMTIVRQYSLTAAAITSRSAALGAT